MQAALRPFTVFPVRRAAFCVLLCAVLAEPHVSSSAFEFPAITHAWALVPFALLMVLPVFDRGHRRRLLNLDLTMMMLPVAAIALERAPRQWPVLLLYVSLAYLALRMVAAARSSSGQPSDLPTPAIPRAWLLAGIAILALVHVSWAMQSNVSSDVGEGGVNGALRIVHGQSLYGARAGTVSGTAQHTDTYGPFNYEAYIPLALGVSRKRAALLTALFFDLLTAGLLFVLGRRTRGEGLGITLAFCWLAFPLTLYEDALGFNDSIVAATLVAIVLVAHRPGRRGAMAALAVWSKLSPLALVPLLATYQLSGRDRGGRSAAFAAAFAAATAVIFFPALAHGTPAAFISRTIGFQAGREPSHSAWGTLEFAFAGRLAWLKLAAVVLHGLLAALVGAFVILSFRIRYRQDAAGLAAMAAAILISIQSLLGYYSYSYILWFAPLVLFAVLTQLCASFEVPESTGTGARVRPRGHAGEQVPSGARGSHSAARRGSPAGRWHSPREVPSRAVRAPGGC